MVKTARKTLRQRATSVAKVDNSQQLVVLVAVVSILLLALSSAVYYRYKFVQSTQVNAADYYGYKKWSPNEIVVSKDLAFSFNGAKSDKMVIPNFWELEEGAKYVIIDATFKNSGNQPYQLSPILTMKLVDETGKEYGVTSAPAITNGLGGEVAPGATVKGEVGFTVPEAENKFTFVFDPSLASSAPISVNFALE